MDEHRKRDIANPFSLNKMGLGEEVTSWWRKVVRISWEDQDETN